MRYCVFGLLELLALESSHSWQTQVPRTRARAETRHWRRPSTQLEAGLDPELVPALTASTALFVGAAGALFYNRVIGKEQKEIGAAESAAEAHILDTQAINNVKDAAETEAQISKVIKKEVVESRVEKVENRKPLEEVVTPDRTGTSNNSVSPVAAMETTDGGTITSLNGTPSKIKDEKPAETVEASSAATDLKSPKVTSTRPPTTNAKGGVSTVGEPNISPTSEERALGSTSRDKDAEPSFISLLETSQKTNKEAENDEKETTMPSSFDKTVASDKPKEKKPAIKVAMNPSSTTSSAVGTVTASKGVDNEPFEKETVRNAWLPSKRGIKDPSTSNGTPVRETAASVSTPSVQVNGATAAREAQETVKASVATPEVNDTPATTTATSLLIKETEISSAKTVDSQPASNTKNEVTSSEPKIRLNIKETPSAKENGSSQSTKDTIKSISKPVDLNNGTAPKPPSPETKTAVTQVAEPATTTFSATDSTAREPDISLKSILSPPETQEFDEDTAYDSLQQYIQNKARDMTLKRMGEKAGFDVLQPTVKEESRVMEPEEIKRETIDDKMPVFMAPKVDDPYAETPGVKDDSTNDANAVQDDPKVVTKASSDSASSSDEQVAKSLKKSPSLTKKAQKSVVLVAAATCAVFVGKRLVSVVLGRGML